MQTINKEKDTLPGKTKGYNKTPLYSLLSVKIESNYKVAKKQPSVSHYFIILSCHLLQVDFLKGSLNMRYHQ
jgi:hypothetical protein